MLTTLDKIRLNINIINIRFKYSNMDPAYSDTDKFEPLQTNSVSNTIRKYPYRYHPYPRAYNYDVFLQATYESFHPLTLVIIVYLFMKTKLLKSNNFRLFNFHFRPYTSVANPAAMAAALSL